MKISRILILFLFSMGALSAAGTLQHEVSPDVRAKEFSLKKKLMLEGYDVVSYQQADGPKRGSAAHEVEYKGVLYHFANAENQAAFLADPERYEPLYGGWCAYAMLDGGKTKSNPESYKIVDGHLLVFYDGLWGDTLKMWNEKLSDGATDQALIEQADREWEDILR